MTEWPILRHVSTACPCKVLEDWSPLHEIIQMFCCASGAIRLGFHLPATSKAPANNLGSLSDMTIDDMQPIDCPVV